MKRIFTGLFLLTLIVSCGADVNEKKIFDKNENIDIKDNGGTGHNKKGGSEADNISQDNVLKL